MTSGVLKAFWKHDFHLFIYDQHNAAFALTSMPFLPALCTESDQRFPLKQLAYQCQQDSGQPVPWDALKSSFSLSRLMQWACITEQQQQDRQQPVPWHTPNRSRGLSQFMH